MAIPKNITTEIVVQAIGYINEHGVPYHNQSVIYDLVTSDGRTYPPKYVLAVASAIANHSIGNGKVNVKGFDATQARVKLTELGFTIVKKEQYATIPELNKYEIDITKEEVQQLEENTSKKFSITFDDDGPKITTHKQKTSFVARKIDFDRINTAKKKIGALGEEIVFDMLQQWAKENGLKIPIHASKEEGNGLGYDIRAFDEQGNEIHIEVKASKKKFSDGFEMTRNEVNASLDYPDYYKVYYVYAIDIDKRECSIKIYDGPFTDELYKMEPTSYRIYQQ